MNASKVERCSVCGGAYMAPRYRQCGVCGFVRQDPEVAVAGAGGSSEKTSASLKVALTAKLGRALTLGDVAAEMSRVLTGACGGKVEMVFGVAGEDMVQAVSAMALREAIATLRLAGLRILRSATLPPDADEPDYPDGFFCAWVAS
jgi:hypothetical protein